MNLTKNDTIKLEIYDITNEGCGVGKYNDFIIFVPRAVTGDIILCGITKIKKNFAYGRIMEFIKFSDNRVKAPLGIHDKCGGCTLQHLSYDAQLELKENFVKRNLIKIGGFSDINIKKILPMKNPYHYRNKVQYPILRKNDEFLYGFYSPNSHNILPNPSCLIQATPIDTLMQYVCSVLKTTNIDTYNENNLNGYLRHIVIRHSKLNNNLMLGFIINSTDIKPIKKILNKLIEYPNIASIQCNINTANTNVILGNKNILLYGDDFIIDSIGNKKYKLSLNSFFQVNNQQTEVLYNKIVEFANFNGSENVIDLYCGIGSIGIYISDFVNSVLGIEIVPDAIANANDNKLINNSDNINFLLGDATSTFHNVSNKHYFDTLIVDPPRKGLTPQLIDDILEFEPNKIIYVSCDSTTLARDLKSLCKDKYSLDIVQPVDMFPMTMHVETIVLLSKHK